jgi:hypothetical protein
VFAKLSAVLDYLLCIYIFDVPFLMDRQTFHEPPVLLRRHIDDLGCIPGPLESAILEPFVQQQKSIAFPKKPLDPVGSSAAEQEERISVEWVKIILMLDDPGEAIDALRRSV